ncbi:hypothetical protein [Sphingobium sp. TKS]|uniref:hypothetical protein n=1 Tax=Sphingobium sp. TKS TaxID=1315974 RepID=UPI0007700887|nr:hypothetical protein [Sphingobium sp. TKS]AMK24389.1 hypothetical protein K426_17285 [Sphingobium sp. TKS]
MGRITEAGFGQRVPEGREGRFPYEVALLIAGHDDDKMGQSFQPTGDGVLDVIGQQAMKGRIERQQQGRFHGIDVVK